jgi:hypothetical protein
MSLTTTTPPAPPAPIDPLALREELELLNRKLLLHNRGEELLEDAEYARSLRRSLEIIGSMNTTISTPSKTKGKKIAVKQAPKTLDDL